jgi:hypothetical protein
MVLKPAFRRIMPSAQEGIAMAVAERSAQRPTTVRGPALSAATFGAQQRLHGVSDVPAGEAGAVAIAARTHELAAAARTGKRWAERWRGERLVYPFSVLASEPLDRHRVLRDQ